MPARLLVAIGTAIVLSGCATAARFSDSNATTHVDAPAAIDFSLFLIGDAGQPAQPEPVLRGLNATMTAASIPAAVVFLGDNIYPNGLPPAAAPDRREMERRLTTQINAVPATADGIFVPGNHDWARSGRTGLRAIQEQSALIEASAAGRRIVMSPTHGCPGPVPFDTLNARLRLIALDTQWWLHKYDKGSTCSESTKAAVASRLDGLLASAGDRTVVLVSHHPMLSTGEHGGHYVWWKYPLIYPFARMLVRNSQDLASTSYGDLREQLGNVLRKYRPLVWAGGHEHTQEVLQGDTAKYFLVSGAGIYGHLTATGKRSQTMFKHAASGFMKLDMLSDGRVWLTVFEVDAAGTSAPVYGKYLE